jgi:iron complex outermembrane receptor protein
MGYNKVRAREWLLSSSASALAVSAAALVAFPGQASAQATPSPNSAPSQSATVAAAEPAADDGTIIVTGTRRALRTSQAIKKNADTVVDSITATDIGAFPDKSIAESLQRVPGVTVNRFSASDDTSHLSGDPSAVLVRGLAQVRSEYNGRDTFSANSSRGLSWEDIAPELMAGVDVFKNQTAEMIEGGIAGSVNLRTRVPFDSTGQIIQGNVSVIYNDLRKKATPDISALYSNRWTTGIGEVGILLDGAYSKVASESQGVVYGRTGVFQDVYQPGAQYIPSSVGYRDTNYDRTRQGFAGALQWKSLSNKVTTTLQFNRSKYHETWREHGVISYLTDMFSFPAEFVFTNTGAHNTAIPRVAPGTAPFTFDENGNFLTGTLVNQQTDFSWWGGGDTANGTGQASNQIALNDLGQPMLHACYSWGTALQSAGPGPGGCGFDARGPDLNAVTRFNDTHRMTQDVSFNIRWSPTDRFDFNFDAQYVDAKLNNYDVEVGQYSFANVSLDTTGDHPVITLLDPTNINQSAGGLSNPNNYRYNHAMDHVEDSDGTELALRADGVYRMDSDWLNSLHFGGRYSDRDQTVRYSNYNWGNIVNDWNIGANQYPYWNIDHHTASGAFNGYPTGLYDVQSFGGSFFGGSRDFVFFDMKQLENHGADQLSAANLGIGQDNWGPACSNVGANRSAEIPGTCFRPDEINKVSETTKSAYAMLKFGGPDVFLGKIGVAGNIGIRYVRTDDDVSGSTVFPALSGSATSCARSGVPAPGAPVPAPYTLGCYLFGNAALLAGGVLPGDIVLAGTPSIVNFADGTGHPQDIKTGHDNWLPSFNVRFDLGHNWLVRFAASRAMSRPDIGLLKNYTTFHITLPDQANSADPLWVRNGSGTIIGANAIYTASSYNPKLKPMTATMFDMSVENYFADVGQFSAAVFYKKFQNYIQYGSRLTDFTNGGVTNTIEERLPLNGHGGKVYGIEGSFQRFFDFLPGALSGFGVQVNATYVKNKGITNSGLKNQSGGDGGSQGQPGTLGTVLTVDSLEGLSKYTYNLVGMYEKYGLAVRLAYNWRSKFLVTAVDCCTYLPAWQMSGGYLDGSIRYAINDHIELSLQASNLLNTEAKLKQQVTSVDNGAILVPNSWFENGRRFQLGVRAKF